MRILLAEDNRVLGDWLEKALRHDGFAVDCMRDGADADHVLLTQHYDAVILDLGLPRVDGLEVLRRLRRRGSQVPVLVLTARGETDDRVRGLNLGADDYLPKPFALSELEARLNALIRRSQGGANPKLALGPLEYESVSRMFRLQGEALALRPREHAVLEVLLMRAGKAVSKAALHEHVFSLDATTGPEAVEIYIHRLRKRLEGSGVAIVTLRGLGYVLEPERA
ncbi:MAG TPA: response regulator [Usitatibacter sp.]|nr:response regulator [Usitatibacter sp.]